MDKGKKFVMSLFVIFCYLMMEVYSETPSPPPSTTMGKVICKKNEDEPDFMPNVYECDGNERCCFNEGAPSCCGTDINKDAIIEQALLWGVLIAVLLIVGLFAYCYFNDNYCCDGDPDDENRCCGLCPKRKDVFKSGKNINEVLYPDEAEARRVEDPIFGKLGKADEVPEFATIDTETEEKYKGKGPVEYNM